MGRDFRFDPSQFALLLELADEIAQVAVAHRV